MTKLIVFIGIFLGLVMPVTAQDQGVVAIAEPEPVTAVRLRTLDKITARIDELDVPLDTEIRFGTLAIKARYCRQTPPEEKPETFAYMEIMDVKQVGDRIEVYKGWMIASSPAITALEHAVYDVWVIGCKTIAPDVVVGSE